MENAKWKMIESTVFHYPLSVIHFFSLCVLRGKSFWLEIEIV